MKIRECFVSNSSSSSFIVNSTNTEDIKKRFEKYYGKLDDCVYICTFTKNMSRKERNKQKEKLHKLTWWNFKKCYNDKTYIVTTENLLDIDVLEKLEKEFGVRYQHLG